MNERNDIEELSRIQEFPIVHLRIIPLGRGAARLTLFPVCGKIAASFDGIHWPDLPPWWNKLPIVAAIAGSLGPTLAIAGVW